MTTRHTCRGEKQPNGDIIWACSFCSYRLLIVQNPPGMKYLDKGAEGVFHSGGEGGIAIESVVPYQTVDPETDQAFRDWINQRSKNV